MIAVSTYSGECDGLGYAAELAGIEVAAYCESDPKRRAKLAEKHPGKPIFHSDEELTANALHAHGIYPDLLFGGPPCQPFSCAGAQRGTADPRHRWPEMLRLIRECRPRWVLVENVGNFVNLALDDVLADLEAKGYEAGAVVLPALAVGAPHRRDRCFVVAYAKSTRLQVAGHKPEQQEAPGKNGAKHGCWRSVESGVGGVASRLPARLDEIGKCLDDQMSRWPAWRGQEQYPWEPPRTIKGMPDRPRRIESLGLAVMPWQVYPIFALMRALDEERR